ncbi:hypothetical protein ACNA2A_28970, partial [Klebsiella pneumoniae]
DDLFVGKTLLHGDVLMWLMKTLLTSGCTNQRGAGHERVLVVIDDEEARFSQYSYGKYFQYIPLSDNDLANLEEGKESVLDRTRRLFYVCCSRALKDLAVVIFVPDVAVAQAAIVEQNLFPASTILGQHDLS